MALARRTPGLFTGSSDNIHENEHGDLAETQTDRRYTSWRNGRRMGDTFDLIFKKRMTVEAKKNKKLLWITQEKKKMDCPERTNLKKTTYTNTFIQHKR